MRTTFVIAVLGMTGLAGCSIPGHPDGGCTFAGRACEAVAGGWLVRGRELSGSVSLVVRSGPLVRLEDVHVGGEADVRLDVQCACVVQGRDFTVHATGARSQVWLLAAAPAGGTVALDGMEATGLWRLEASSAAGVARLANITLACGPDAAGIQLDGEAMTEGFALADVRATGCSRVSLSQRDQAAGGPALALAVVRTNLTATGRDDGIYATAGTRYALRLLDSRISGTRYAIDLRDGDTGVIADSVLEKSEEAVNMAGGAHLSMTRTTVADNGGGLRIWDGSRVEVDDSAFLRNGLDPAMECHGAIQGQASGYVHNSVLQGNALGVGAYSGLPTPFDATGNYWGSPAGPLPTFSCSRVASGGPLGDAYFAGSVDVVPFLTSPP